MRKNSYNKIFISIYVFSFVFLICFVIFFQYSADFSNAIKADFKLYGDDFKSLKAAPDFDTCPPHNYTFDNPEILKLLKTRKQKKCEPKIPLTLLENGTLRINEKHSDAQKYRCKARCAIFAKNYQNNYTEWVNFEENPRLDCDIIPVVCERKDKKKSPAYAYIHTQIKEYNRDRRQLFGPYFEETFSPKVTNGDFHPDVHIVILDSIGRFPMKRQMPKTIHFLETEMRATEMKFHARVADNSRPNSFAMFFGEIPIEVDNTIYGGEKIAATMSEHDKCLTKYLDDETFFQFEYEDSGYKTMWANDWSIIYGSSNCKGFLNQISTHYMRPFEQMIEHRPSFIGDINKYQFKDSCQPHHVHGLQYWEKFLSSYPGIPKTSVFWNNDAHSDETLLNDLSVDLSVEETLKRNAKRLENSFLFVMADHGQRINPIVSTEQGDFEANNPVMFVVLPKRLRDSPMHKILQEKADLLTSHHDFYATLIDIVRHQPATNFTDTNQMKIKKTYGSSWLREYDKTVPRSCRSLLIPSQYCICNYGEKRILTADMKKELKATIEKDINDFLSNSKLTAFCEPIGVKEVSVLSSIRDGFHSELHKITFDTHRMAKFSVNYKLSISTGKTGFLKSSPGWDRISKYGNQSACLPPEMLAKHRHLCYCKE